VNAPDAEARVTVRNKQGLHARPSSVLAQKALSFPDTTITLRRGSPDLEVDAKSIMELILLEARHGTELVISARGPEAAAAVEALKALFERQFDLTY
jgi:phosphotransferase system HPr (HPr) family protein